MLRRLSLAARRAAAHVGATVARAGAAIVAPVEWAFAATFGRLFRGLEAFEGAADWLIGPLRRLAWHAGALWRLMDRFNLDAPLRWLAWLLQPAWRPLAAVACFSYAWLTTRPYRSMAWGFPAVVLLAPVIVAVAWGGAWGRERVAVQYRAAIQEARDAADDARVQLLERKLVQLGVDSPRTDFRSALMLEQEGRFDEAFARMQRLAPESSLGYPLAHEWLAVKLVNGDIDLSAADRLRMAGAHLDRLDRLGAKGPDMALLRAAWLVQGKRLEEAADVLAPYLAQRQLAALRRMEINLQLQRLDEARRDARALVLHLRESRRTARRRGATLDPDLYQAWVDAERLLGDQAALARVARQWIRDEHASPTARLLVASVAYQELESMLASTHPDAAELAERVIEMATAHDEPAWLEAHAAVWVGERRQAPAIAAMIDELVTAESTPLSLRAAFGTAAAADGQIKLARQFLERIVAEDPRHATAWNNYAWTLAQPPAQDLARALDAANRAIALSPEVRFRETRGQILVALERWREAVDDLEFALNGMPDARAIHASLAKAYSALGEEELADAHRRQAP